MKVQKLKLNEASSAVINSWKTKYAEANTPEEKLDVVKEALQIDLDIDKDIIDKLISFGPVFVDSWIKAMKWDELGREDNEFVKLLKNSKPNSMWMKNSDNFSKIYNVYSNGFIEYDYFIEPTFRKLISHDRPYSFSDEDFKYIFKIYDKSKEADLNDVQINTIFFDESGDVNQPATIQRNYENITGDKNNNESDLTDEKIEKILNSILTDEKWQEYVKNKLGG